MKRYWTYMLLILVLFYLVKEGQALGMTMKGEGIKEAGSLNAPGEKDLTVKEKEAYVPVWSIAAELGMEFSFEPEKALVLKKGDGSLTFWMHDKRIETAEGEAMEGSILIDNDNVYVPAELVAGYFSRTAAAAQEEPAAEASKVLDAVAEEDEEAREDDGLLQAPVPKGQTVYLTFDDGPTNDIGGILDTLKAKQVKATFFLLEPQMKLYREEVKRLVAEGHYPALHSVTHDRDKLYFGNPGNVAMEMEQTRKTLLDLTGVDSRLTRVPYGSKPYMKDALRDPLVTAGFKMWDWNVDTVDWKHQKSNPKQIVEEVKKGVAALKGSGKPIVILMHVNKGTASVLPEIIDYLIAEGLACEAYDPDSHFTMNFWEDNRL